jgi:hypothetical protein
MDDWSTYRLEDFLMFSRDTYFRLFELHNQAVWPSQILTMLMGLGLLWIVWRRPAWGGRVAAGILAVCWAWVAVAFHLTRYADITWAAPWLAAGFGLQALLLLSAGVAQDGLDLPDRASRTGWAALTLLLFALVLQPLIGPALGRDWAGVELFGTAPDPTVVATLGVIATARPRALWLLLPIPMLWCALSGATLQAMDAPDAILMPTVAMVALALAVAATLRRFR